MSKKGKTLFVRSVWVMLTIFFILLFAFVTVGGSIAKDNSGPINDMFGINPYKKVQIGDVANEDMEHYKSDFVKKNPDGTIKYTTDEDGYRHQVYDDKAMRAASEKVAEQTAVEGSVLLWNDNDALPLASGDGVSVYGMGSVDYVVSGSGSGALDAPNPMGRSLSSALESKGLSVNSRLVQTYNGLLKDHKRRVWHDENMSTNYMVHFLVNEAPWSAVSDVTEQTIDQYGDAAITVISRTAGEDYDISENVEDSYADGGNNYLELTAQEADVLGELKKLKDAGRLKKSILILNTANPMQFAEIPKDEYGVDACVWTGMGGTAGFMQIADVVAGHESYAVSGKSPDILLKNNRSAPSYVNFGDYTWTEYSKEIPDWEKEYGTYYQTHNLKYIVYQEGIYVGYRYYETRYADYVLGRGNASGTAGSTDGEGWSYSDEVAFPFGYGGSYAEFEYSDYKVTESDDAFQVSMKITNVSTEHAGKDVMQVYLQKPYTGYDEQNGIEKSAVELVGFAKTDLLQPNGGSQVLKITIDKDCMRTYDAYGHKTYILEAGDYYIAAGTDSHDALNNILAASNLNEEQKARMDAPGNSGFVHKVTVNADDYEIYSVSEKTGNEITNRLDDADINLYEGTSDQRVTYLSRKDWNATYPRKAPELKCVNDRMVEDMQYGHKPEIKEGDTMPVYGKVTAPEGTLTIAMLRELEFDDPKWQDLLNQMTLGDQQKMASGGFYGLTGSDTVGAPGGKASDGPSGCTQPNPTTGDRMAFPSPVVMAATWNTSLISQLGVAFAHEVMHAGNQVLYAPGGNIHRSHYGGRNFEYYSEDPVLSAEMLNAETASLVDRGIIVMAKHFVFNDQERNRLGVATFLNEQSAREIYLKAFEKVVIEDNINGLMSSFNRVGLTWMGAHKGVLTDILRGELGYKGVVETDACTGNTFHMQLGYARSEGLLAGNDMWMNSAAEDYFDESKDNPTVMLALRQSCHRILYVMLNSVAMNGMSMNTRIVYITPWWETALFAMQIAFGVIMACCFIMAVLSFVFNTDKYQRMIATRREAKATAASMKSEAPRTGSASYGTAESAGDAPPSGDGDGGKGSFLSRHKKLAIIIAGITVAAIIAVSIIVPVTTCGGDVEPPPVPPVTHECEEKCPVCGGCLTDCEDPVCAVKCGDGKTPYTFEAEEAEIVNGSADYNTYIDTWSDAAGQNPISFIANLNGNQGATVTFSVNAEKDTTATLGVSVTRRTVETVFTDKFSVSVNGQDFQSPATVPAYENEWTYGSFMDFRLGCVNLKEGVNVIVFTVLTPMAYNFDSITLFSDSPLTKYVPPKECEFCATCGGCLDADCANGSAICGEGKTAYTLESEEYATVIDGPDGWWGTHRIDTNGAGRTYIANLSGTKGSTVTFKVKAAKDMTASLHLTITRRAIETVFTETMSVEVNGVEMTSPKIIPAYANQWDDSSFADFNLGCVALEEGENTIVFTTLTQSEYSAYDFDKITLYGEAEINGVSETLAADKRG